MKIINNVVINGNLPKEPITVQATEVKSLSTLSFECIVISLEPADYNNLINNKTAIINFEFQEALSSIAVKGIVNSTETVTFWAGTLTVDETIMAVFGDIGNNKLYVYLATA
jgi:hypothetical protein